MSEDVGTVCMWCLGNHGGARCPFVKAMEFYKDGKMKRVEFWSAAELPTKQSTDEPNYEKLKPSFDFGGSAEE